MNFGKGRTTLRLFLFGTLLGVFFAFVLIGAVPVRAVTGINQQINFQGRLLDSTGATAPDGFYNIQFKIYQDGDGQSVGNATGSPAGVLKWTEDYLNTAGHGVKVQNGFLSVQLGSVNAFGGSIDWNQSTLWLSMNIGNTNVSCSPFSSCSPDGEMVPMQAMTAAVYALNANQLGGLTAASFGQLSQNQVWTGYNTYRPATDSTTAFKLQNQSAGTNYVTGDSTNNQLILGAASSLSGKLAFATVGGGTLTVVPTSSASSFTLTLPAETGTVCTTAAAGVCSVAGSGYVQLAPLAVQTDGTANNTIFVNKTNATGNIVELQKSGTDVFKIDNTGAVLSQNSANSTSAFNIKTQTGGNLFTVDTSNSRVGINLGGSSTPTLYGNGLEVHGALRLSGGGGGTDIDLFNTPVGSNVATKINIPYFDPGASGQVLAFGIPSGSSTSSRVLSVFDARTTTDNQPAVSLFSPDENNVFGLGFDGSNTMAKLKTNSGATTVGITIQSGNVTSGSATSSGSIVIQSGNGTSTNSSSGSITIDSGAKTGTGTVGSVNIGNTRATTIALGNSGSTNTIVGTTNINTTGTTNTAIGASGNTTTIVGATNINTTGSATTTVGNASGAVALQGATTASATGLALTVTNDATIGRLGVNTSTFGTVEKFAVNASTTMDNLAATLLGSGATTSKALVIQGVASQTADLFQAQASTGAVLLRVSASGVLGSADTTSGSTNSADTTIRTGNTSGATSNTGALNLKTGDATTGASGAVNIDSGSASGGAFGAINIGTVNSVATTVGNTGANTNTLIQGGSGSSAIQILQGLGGTITIGTNGTGSNVQILCGVIAGSGCGFANNATDHSTTIGSATGTSLTTVKGGSGGITLTGNISASGTYNTNTFSSTALTFAGANPVISASTSNTGLSLQANGSGTLALTTTGAGTINLGTTGATTLGIGNSGSTNTILGASTLTGTVNINNTGTSATTIGQGTSTAGTILIQGGVSSTFSVTNSSGKSVLSFAAPSTAGTVTYQLPNGGTGGNTYGICTTFVVCSGYGASGGANTALSNLAAVAINISLLPGVTNSIDVGSAAFTFANGYFGTSVQVPLISTSDQTAASTNSSAFIARSGDVSGTASDSGAATFRSGNASRTTGGVTIKSGNSTTSGNSGDVTIDVGTVTSGTKGSITLGSSNASNITIGSSTTTTTLIQGGAGGAAISLQAATNGAINIGTTNNNSVSIGSTSNTNALTFGQSTAGETINIENSATAAATTVNILSGIGTAGIATLNMGNNTRITSIDLGNVAPAANRVITIGAGSGKTPAFIDTINIGTGATSVAGGETVNIATGTPTGSGTNLVNIGSTTNASTTIIQGGTGSSAIQLTQATGAGIVIGNPNTGSTVSIQCGAGTSTSCGFANNGNDHTTTVGSNVVASQTVIQSGTAGISLNGAVTTSSTINTNTLSATALTFSGANPVISSSVSNTGITLQSNGTGTTTVDSGAATGTVNLGFTNATSVRLGNTTAATQTIIQGGTGASALSMQVGTAGTISVGTTAAATLNIGSTTAATVTNISGGTSGTAALNLQVGNGGAINIGTTVQTSIQNIGNTSASSTTLINGGTSGTAIQILQGTGGTLTLGGTGAGSITNLQCGSGVSCNIGTNATDHTTTLGGTTTASPTIIQAGTSGIALAQNTTLNANYGLTMASGIGQFLQTFTGTTTDAHTITASSLTTGKALKVNSTNNSGAAGTSWAGTQFNATNSQGTTAATGFIFGSDFEFTQSATVAGNNESAVNIAVAATGGSPTDNTVSSILNLANNDDATGNLVQVTDAIKVTATTANNIINGLNFNGTFQTNLIYTSTNNYTLTAAGAVTQAGNQTFTGATPIISASATNANLTVRTNGTGTLALETTGAGTINVGTANTTTIGIGSSTAATQTTIQGGTSATALNLYAAANGTINMGTSNANVINIGTTNAAATTAISGGTGATAVSIQTGAGGTTSIGTTAQTSTLNLGNASASSTTTINGGTGASAIQIIQGTAGTLTLGGTGANSVTNLNCGSGTSSCNLGSNATDHTTNVGSVTGASLTAIQGGTSGITLTSGQTVASVLTGGFNVKTNTNSATAFRVQNTGSNAVITVDTSTPALKIFAGAGGANYLGLTYNDGTTTGTIAASAGTTAVGSGSGAISILAGAGASITTTANATSLWRTTAGTLTIQSGTSSDLILTSGSSIVQISGSSVVKLGASAGDPGTCTAGAIVYNTTANALRGCQGASLAWQDLVNLTVPTLQQVYTASTGGTTPEIKLGTTRTALDIQDADTTLAGALLNVRASNAGGLGAALFSVTSTGTTNIQDTAGLDLFTADTANSRVQIGAASPHTTGDVVLVLDNFQPTSAGAEPTEVDGAMYYDADNGLFRCSSGGFWQSCNINNIQDSYIIEEEFVGGTTTTGQIGALGWNVSTIGATGTLSYNTTMTPTADRPGTFGIQTTGTSNQGNTVWLGGNATTGNQIVNTTNDIKASVAVGATVANTVLRVGLLNETTGTASGNEGVWIESDGTTAQWRYCYGTGSAATCAVATTGNGFATTHTITASTWVSIQIRVISTTSAIYCIDQDCVTKTLTGIGTTNRVNPAFVCQTTTTSARNCYIDYYQLTGTTSAPR